MKKRKRGSGTGTGAVAGSLSTGISAAVTDKEKTLTHSSSSSSSSSSTTSASSSAANVTNIITPKYSDVRLIFRGHHFACNKALLTQSSKVFAAMFESESHTEKEEVVEIPANPSSVSEFGAFLAVLHTPVFAKSPLKRNTICAVTRLTFQFDCPGVTHACEKYLRRKWQVIFRSSFDTLLFAQDNHLEDLRRDAAQITASFFHTERQKCNSFRVTDDDAHQNFIKSLRPGSTVSSQWVNGQWYPAVVISIGPTSHTVRYTSDGVQYTTRSPSELRPLAPPLDGEKTATASSAEKSAPKKTGQKSQFETVFEKFDGRSYRALIHEFLVLRCGPSLALEEYLTRSSPSSSGGGSSKDDEDDG